MKLYIVESKESGVWKPVSLHKENNFRTLLNEINAVGGKYRIKRVKTQAEAATIQLHPDLVITTDTNAGGIEWVS